MYTNKETTKQNVHNYQLLILINYKYSKNKQNANLYLSMQKTSGQLHFA